jgi:Arm DNA-binding domain
VPKLTVASVKKYKPHAKRREIADSGAPGLFLIIQAQPSGLKSWALRFRRPDGRPAKLTLGRVDLSGIEPADAPVLGGALTLRQAHQLANEIDRKRARGIDVVEEHKPTHSQQRAAARDRAVSSFGTVAREFFADHETKWHARPRHWRSDARLLGLVYPSDRDPAHTKPEVVAGSLATTWSSKPVVEIEGYNIHTAVDEARKIGIPGMPPRNRGTSEARGRGAPPARERVLSEAEIRFGMRVIALAPHLARCFNCCS